jgi:hypothetical protein
MAKYTLEIKRVMRSDDQFKEDEVGGECEVDRREEKCTHNVGGKASKKTAVWNNEA